MWWQRKPSPEVEAALARVAIFSTLERRDLQQLSLACLLRHYRAGDAILEEGSTGLGMFLITNGRVEVFKTDDGRRVSLAVLGDGAVLGEIALLDDQPRSASAVALEDTDCLLLSRDRFRTLLSHRPRIAWPIVPSLAKRVRDLQARLLEAEHRTPASPREEETGVAEPHPAPALSARDPSTASEAQQPASQQGRQRASEEATRGADGAADGPDLLRTPYAMMMTGAVGFGESVRLAEVFLRSLDETSGLASGRPMGAVLRGLPESLVTAGMSSWEQGRRLPVRLLDTFRGHLRSDWRRQNRA